MAHFEEIWSALAAIVPGEADRTQRLNELAKLGADDGRAPSQAETAERVALRSELDGSTTRAASLADALLKRLSPNAALHLADRAGTLVDSTELVILTEHAGLDRFMWVIAAGGGGNDVTDKLLSDFLHASARWCALRFTASLLVEVEVDIPMSISLNPEFERIRRHMSTEIRFAWISRLIAKTTAEVVASDPIRFGSLSGVLTPATVDELFDYLSAYPFAPGAWTMLSGAQGLSEALQGLMRAMGVEAGSQSSTSFTDLVLGVRAETEPFVTFGKVPLPMAIREIAFSVEHPIFELARRALPDPGARGDLFELVISACLAKVLPATFAPLDPPINVPVSPTNAGEIDFALSSPSGVLLIGEAKAYLVTNAPETVINAFGAQVRKASDQLRKRLDALSAGQDLTDKSGSFGPTSHYVRYGIGVPMHSYSTAIYNRASLAVAGAAHRDIAMIPLHQLLLVASLMADSDDLRTYLEIRWAAIDSGLQILDEADLLLAFVAGKFESGAQVSERFSSQSDTVMMLGSATMNPATSMLILQPRSPQLWKATFLVACQTSFD